MGMRVTTIFAESGENERVRGFIGMSRDRDHDKEGSSLRPSGRRLKETSKRLRRGNGAPLAHRSSLDWRMDQRTVCDVGAAAEFTPVESLKETILRSRTGAALLSGPAAEKTEIVYDAQTPVSQYYPAAGGKRIIALNPNRPFGDLINLLVRELRRAWQHSHGALINPLNFEPDEAILVNRAQQADALMISIKVAWELKLVGEQAAWNYISGSPLADVGRTFEVKAQTDFRTLNNGEAARAAYDKFFEDSRTKAHDKRIIHQMLLDETGYIRASQKPEKVSMDLFKRLGEMPHGRNYLSMKARRAPVDTCYATVEDRSNANFLWFIKFERSFQEKEARMIEESVRLSAEIVDFARWSAAARQEKI